MLRGLFVTGTDTGVGKTVAAAALLHRYRGQFPLKYWKPIQTGIEQDDDTATQRTYEYYDPIYTLPAEGQAWWREHGGDHLAAAEERAAASRATAAAQHAEHAGANV